MTKLSARSVRDGVVRPWQRCWRLGRSLAYNLSTVDVNGRVVARAALEAMGWSSGRSLDVRRKSDLIVVTADPAGVESVTAQGNLRLPLLLRSWHRLAPGAQVLVVAEPDRHRLVIHPLAVLDAVLGRFHTAVLDGGENT